MSKAIQKKNHWSAKVSECAVRRNALGDVNVPLHGGAEDGEFVYVGRVDPGTVSYDHGSLTEGELVLEVDTLPVSGLPLYDVLSAARSSRGAVRLKTVRQGNKLTKDLKLYLSQRFQKSSEDYKLQQTIRDNLYRHAVPFFSIMFKTEKKISSSKWHRENI